MGTRDKRIRSGNAADKAVNDITKVGYKQNVPQNIFSGLDISLDTINQRLPQDFDTQSVISSKSRKELKDEVKHLPKKVKLKLKQDRFKTRIDFLKAAIQQRKVKKRKQKKGLTGELQSLIDALPTAEELEQAKAVKSKRKAKPRGILKKKQRHMQQNKDAKLFQRILNDKIFQKNPAQVISEYVKQKVESNVE